MNYTFLEASMDLVRLNKYLKDLGLCSRRQADEFIAKGYVKVNGQIVSELGLKINPQLDVVEALPALAATTAQFRYLLLNKPKGYVCSKSRADGQPIFELLPAIKGLAYAGRLDKDSHGLVLLSNDGQFVYKAFAAEFAKEKEYLVRVNKPVTAAYLATQAEGSIVLDGKTVRPARVKQTAGNEYRIILTEGLNRQLRRMAEVCAYRVLDLQRIRIAHIKDNQLASGAWRELSLAEVKQMMAS